MRTIPLLLLLAACAGASSTDSAEPAVTDGLPGAAGDSAHAAIPAMPYVAEAAHYTGWPTPGPGAAWWSHDTLVLLLTADATVAEANDLLTSLDAQIVGGSPPVRDGGVGWLVLRLPTATHAELEAELEVARAHPAVDRIVQDVLMEPDHRPQAGLTDGVASDDSDDDWVWGTYVAGGNWGHEALRLPQAWNLNAKARAAGAKVRVVVIDDAFQQTHPDLEFDHVLHTRDASADFEHGTLVAGLLAAKHDDGTGVDGVSPFVDLVGVGYPPVEGSDVFELMESWYHTLATDFETVAPIQPRIVNRSLGYALNLEYDKDGKLEDPDSFRAVLDPRYAELVSHHAEMLSTRLDELAATGFAPLIVTSAGNEEGHLAPSWNSPECYLALKKQRRGMLCVESLEPDKSGGGWEPALAAHSNGGADSAPPNDCRPLPDGGSLAAPGAGLLSPAFDGTWRTWGGTSAATPFISGMAANLMAYDPDITNGIAAEILTDPDTLLRPNPARDAEGKAVRWGSCYPDAFDALLTWDRYNGDHGLLTQLVDIDDGTEDGNTRVDRFGVSDLSGLETVGDGQVDMRDFRRYRDWLLQIEEDEGVTSVAPWLDGPVGHKKRDANGDDVVDAFENVFPRGDFNGDGQMSGDPFYVAGSLQRDMTDLDVMMEVWTGDPADKARLRDLLESADVHTYAGDCASREGVTRVVSRIVDMADSLVRPEHELGSDAHHIETIPVDREVAVILEGLDSSGATVVSSKTRATLAPGQDLHVSACSDSGTAVLLAQDGDDGYGVFPRGEAIPVDPFTGVWLSLASRTTARGTRGALAEITPEGVCMQLDTESGDKFGTSAWGFVGLHRDKGPGFPTTVTVSGTSSSVGWGPSTNAIDFYDMDGNRIGGVLIEHNSFDIARAYAGFRNTADDPMVFDDPGPFEGSFTIELPIWASYHEQIQIVTWGASHGDGEGGQGASAITYDLGACP